jgi:Zn finger protein HypA/HybF involved in hydrogenase expression
MADQRLEPDVDFGQPIYDGDGVKLGTIRGLDEHGFYVTTEDGIQALSSEHVTSTATFGEAELAWRCWECGAMGDIEALPAECPDCGAPREELYYRIED